MAPSFDSMLSKRKSLVVEEDYEILLNVVVREAEDIDKGTTNYTKRTYGVLGWVEPNQCFLTQEVNGLPPNLVWNSEYCFVLDKSMNYNYLYLEIYRTRSTSDPGTSSGIVLVGRTKISLPNQIDVIKRGWFWLAVPKGSSCVPEGRILVAMEMKKRVKKHG